MSYGGDDLHAFARTACDDPDGAFVVVAPPLLTSEFDPDTIDVGGTSTLTLTFSNPAANTVPLTGVALTVGLLPGLAVATPTALSSDCGGVATALAGSQIATLSGGVLPVGATCTVAFAVTQSERGQRSALTGLVQSANGGSGNAAPAILTAIEHPAIAIDAPNTTPLHTPTHATATLTGGDPTGTLTFRVYRADDVTCATPLFTDDVDVDGTGTYTGPDFPADAAGAYVWAASYSGDSEHAPATTGCGDIDGAFAVAAPGTVSVAFDPDTVDAGEASTLTFTIANADDNIVPLLDVALATTLPDGLVVASPNGVDGDCGGGTVTADPGSGTIALSGGFVELIGTCTFSVDVAAAEQGRRTVTTDAVDSANGGAGNTATATLTAIAHPRSRSTHPARRRAGRPRTRRRR